MLARRALTRAEIESRLAGRTTEEVRAAALRRLEELGVIDDRALAVRVARDAVVRRGLGRYRIRAELLRRGVPDAVVADALEEALEGDPERVAATAALARFCGRRGAASSQQKVRAAAFRHLVGRGFPADLVRDLLEVSL